MCVRASQSVRCFTTKKHSCEPEAVPVEKQQASGGIFCFFFSKEHFCKWTVCIKRTTNEWHFQNHNKQALWRVLPPVIGGLYVVTEKHLVVVFIPKVYHTHTACVYVCPCCGDSAPLSLSHPATLLLVSLQPCSTHVPQYYILSSPDRCLSQFGSSCSCCLDLSILSYSLVFCSVLIAVSLCQGSLHACQLDCSPLSLPHYQPALLHRSPASITHCLACLLSCSFPCWPDIQLCSPPHLHSPLSSPCLPAPKLTCWLANSVIQPHSKPCLHSPLNSSLPAASSRLLPASDIENPRSLSTFSPMYKSPSLYDFHPSRPLYTVTQTNTCSFPGRKNNISSLLRKRNKNSSNSKFQHLQYSVTVKRVNVNFLIYSLFNLLSHYTSAAHCCNCFLGHAHTDVDKPEKMKIHVVFLSSIGK